MNNSDENNASVVELRRQLKKEEKNQFRDAVELVENLQRGNTPTDYTVTKRHPEHWWKSVGSPTEILIGDGDFWLLVDLLGVRSQEHFLELMEHFDLREARGKGSGGSLNLCDFQGEVR